MEEARKRLHADLDAIDTATQKREVLAERCTRLREALAAERPAEQGERGLGPGLTVSCESRRASRTATERDLERARDQQAQAAERHEELVAASRRFWNRWRSARSYSRNNLNCASRVSGSTS